MNKMFSRIFLSFLLAVGVLLGTPETNAVQAQSSGFVTRNGSKFMLDGKEFRFVGFNLFNAASSSFYTCESAHTYSDAELESAFQTMRDQAGATVVRFWAFQKYTKGGQDWTGIDRVIRIAKKYGMKVLPNLEDGPGYCSGGQDAKALWEYNGDTWYTTGYKSPLGTNPLTFGDYAKKIAEHYKNEPTILGWELVNEAETSKRTSDNKSVLVAFAKEMGALVKSVDPNHLVTLGGNSGGAAGSSGTDFDDLAALPEMDFFTAHDYDHASSPLPGSSDGATLPDTNASSCKGLYDTSLLACQLAKSVNIYHKPFFIGEAGIAGGTAAQRTTRAGQFDKKIKAAFDNGAGGYIVWVWSKVIEDEKFDVLASTNDPLLPVMKKYAGYQPVGSTASPSPATSPSPSAVASASPSEIACTEDAKLCPDGSYVGRQAPSCQFKPCPSPTSTASPGASGTQSRVCDTADFNKDGVVNTTDYNVIARTYFKRKTNQTVLRGDLNNDGVIDLRDFSIFRRMYNHRTNCRG